MGLIKFNEDGTSTCRVYSIPSDQVSRNKLTEKVFEFLKNEQDNVDKIEYCFATHVEVDDFGDLKTELEKRTVENEADIRKMLRNQLVQSFCIYINKDGYKAVIIYALDEQQICVMHQNDDPAFIGKNNVELALPESLLKLFDYEMIYEDEDAADDDEYAKLCYNNRIIGVYLNGTDGLLASYTLDSPNEDSAWETIKEYINRILCCKDFKVKGIMSTVATYEDDDIAYEGTYCSNKEELFGDFEGYKSDVEEEIAEIIDYAKDKAIRYGYWKEDESDEDITYVNVSKLKEYISELEPQLSVFYANLLLNYKGRDFYIEFSPCEDCIMFSLAVAFPEMNDVLFIIKSESALAIFNEIKEKLKSLGSIISMCEEDIANVPYWNITPSVSVSECTDISDRYRMLLNLIE